MTSQRLLTIPEVQASQVQWNANKTEKKFRDHVETSRFVLQLMIFAAARQTVCVYTCLSLTRPRPQSEKLKTLMPLAAFLPIAPVTPYLVPRTQVSTLELHATRLITPKSKRSNYVSITMVRTASTMLPLGTTASDFSLLEPLTGNRISLSDVKMDNGLLVVFMCNHCPFVILLQDQLRALGSDLKNMSIGMVGISSNDVDKYPQDGSGPMAEMARSTFSTFPYLLDDTQQVAKAYRAACTPDLYLFDKDLKLVYRGQVDDARPGNGIPVTGKSIRAAASLLSEGRPIPVESMRPSIGCSIKWKRGNEPDYFG